MIKLKVFAVLLCALWLTGCSLPYLDHVIINDSKDVLSVEYEFIAPRDGRDDGTELTAPAKLTLAEYNDTADNEKKWRQIIAPNDYELDVRAAQPDENQADKTQKIEVWRHRLRLAPGEVLRVFRSQHINYDLKNVKRLVLTGDRGRLEIEGDGFEQFAPYSKGGFFSQTSDYRIIYR